jgi:hypothetical protein
MQESKVSELIITRGQLAQLLLPALKAHSYTNNNTSPTIIIIDCPREIKVKDDKYASHTIPIMVKFTEAIKP